MNEADVVISVAEILNNNGWQFFVDDSTYDDDRIAELPSQLDLCGLNRTITIGRRMPDLIGFTNEDDVFAVEAKGESAIRKGIGQAAHYRTGVHRSYLAAVEDSIREFRPTAISCGVGLIEVDDSDIQWTEPNQNIAASSLSRTRRALAVKTNKFESELISFASTTRPVNALLPVVILSRYEGINSEVTNEKCIDLIQQRIDTPDSRGTIQHFLTLAATLGLIGQADYANQTVRATETGKVGYSSIKGIVAGQPKQATLGGDTDEDDRILGYIDGLKSGGKKLYKKDPVLASYFRDRYLSIPDVRLMTRVLSAHHDSRAELSLVLSEIALESPDTFLNLFCEEHRDNDFRELIDNTSFRTSDDDFRSKLLELRSQNALYNLVHQLRHIGILIDGTDAVHQNSEVEMNEYYWEWDPEVVGAIGTGEI